MTSITPSQMQSIETAAFKNGHTPESLMETAGKGIAETILHYYPHHQNFTAYLGKGHNAGDALVALRHLKAAKKFINIRCPYPLIELAPLTRQKLRQLGDQFFYHQKNPAPQSILIDALLGIGASGPLRDPLDALAQEINHHRLTTNSTTIALDIPSGLNGETGEPYQNTITADQTLTIGHPKTSILTETAINHTGAISLIPLPQLDEVQKTAHRPPTTAHRLICPSSLHRKRRPFDFHKGQAGRVGIWAGSEGMLGAAALTARAALHAGAGLITLFTSPTLYPALISILPPEIMVKLTINPNELLKNNFDALIIGPGLGTPVESILTKLFQTIAKTEIPTVLDADILNQIAKHNQHHILKQNHILTPHPGEMARLDPTSKNQPRLETIKKFTQKHPSTLLLKGARTLIAQGQNSPIHHNSTGHPAMASPGQGDTLSGIIGSLCAQGYTNLTAARTAAYLTGEAAQLALITETPETLTATKTLNHLPQALKTITKTTSH